MSNCAYCEAGSPVETRLHVLQFDGAPYHRITVRQEVDLEKGEMHLTEQLVRCKNA